MAKSLKQKLEKASAAVEKAIDVRDDAIQALMDAEFAYSDALEVWGKLHDKTKAGARALGGKLN